MAHSRTSGRVSEAEKATFVRRKGNPGGPRSEAQKLGQRPKVADATACKVTRADLAAFLTGDHAHFVRRLRLQEWEDGPLVNHGARCVQGHAIEVEMPGWGCSDQHRAWALRRQIIAEIERRGRFTFTDLRGADDAVAAVAWSRLADLAAQVGISESRWAEIAGAAGWEKVPPQKRGMNTC